MLATSRGAVREYRLKGMAHGFPLSVKGLRQKSVWPVVTSHYLTAGYIACIPHVAV